MKDETKHVILEFIRRKECEERQKQNTITMDQYFKRSKQKETNKVFIRKYESEN
tara:strand:+ start:285 stop:446 length:162 start_codon:yes stop_codon:yes gene_type:complete